MSKTSSSFLPKLILLVLVPFLAFAVFAGYSINQTFYSTGFAECVLRQAEHLELTFRLITHLQRERTKSALMLTKAISLAELEQQYQDTLPVLEAFLNSTTNASISSELRMIGSNLPEQISLLRRATQSRETFQRGFQEYNRLIYYLQDVQESVAQAFQDVQTARLFNNILLVEATREHAGKLRVNFTRLLASPSDSEGDTLYLLQVTHALIMELLNVRALSLSKPSQKLLSQRYQTPEWRFVNQTMGEILRKRSAMPMLALDSAPFLTAITRVIDDLEEITAMENRGIREIQFAILAREKGQRTRTIALILWIVLFLSYLGYDYVLNQLERNKADIKLRDTLRELSEARMQEITIGWQIQQDLLLGKAPLDLNGARIASKTSPSLGIDGDFIDFFPFDSNTVDVLFGDVMGKGIPAALVGAATKSHFQRAMSALLLVQKGKGFPLPVEIVAHAHERMAPGLLSVERFVSLHYGRFDFSGGRLDLVNCGHTAVLHFQKASRKVLLIEPENAPLGIFEMVTFKTTKVLFGKGDVFLFFSDGITEARNPTGEFYGKQRLIQILLDSTKSHLSIPETVVQKVFDDLLQFSETDKFRDDLTMMVIEAV